MLPALNSLNVFLLFSLPLISEKLTLTSTSFIFITLFGTSIPSYLFFIINLTLAVIPGLYF